MLKLQIRHARKMNENGAVWKSDYPKRHIYMLGTAELLIGLAIIALEVSKCDCESKCDFQFPKVTLHNAYRLRWLPTKKISD